jgi:hypothetical protein
MSRLIESRLREALDARAQQVTEQRLRPSQPTILSVIRGRWVAPLALVAAVTSVLAISSVVAVTQLAEPDLNEPAVSVTTDPSPPTSGTSATTTPPTSPAVTSPPPSGVAVALRPASYRGMTIQLPASWNLIDMPADPGYACVWSADPNVCVFTIVRLDSGEYAQLHAEDPMQVATDHPCPPDRPLITRIAASTLPVGDRTAEYRRYRTTCPSGTLEFDQWTIGTAPAVKFHRLRLDPASDLISDESIAAVVASARFDQPATDQPVTDFGFITGYTQTPEGTFFKFDRAIPVHRAGVGNWEAENNSPQTYQYGIADSTGIYALELCFNPVDPQNQSCDHSDVLSRIDEGDSRSDGGQPVDAIPVWLGLHAGKVVSIGSG